MAAPKVLAVDLDGVVHPVTVEIITSAIEQARREDAEMILLRLNTPGGLMDAMRQSVEKIIASPVPIVSYVTPSGGRAASAGFFLLEAADVAAMAPGTNTGAAHPVILGREMDPVMKQKAENDAAASIRSLVDRRGRNSALSEAAVRQSKSYTDKEALDNKLIDLVARDEHELIMRLDGRLITRFDGRSKTLRLASATLVVYERNLRQKVLSAVSDPNIALMLLVLGALAIYVEFTSPGLILPGVAGAIMVLLGMGAISLLPINWTGAALLVLSIALFVLEAKFTSHGILGVGGAIAMILGAMLLVDAPVPEMRVRLSVAAALAVPFAAITIFLLTLALQARSAKVVTGMEGMAGAEGVAISTLNPEGKVMVRGEYWDAFADAPVAPGGKVRVTAVEGLKLRVHGSNDSR
ncbi:MAG: NfeD family protein [Bryobacteraceae bacterium]